MKNRKQFFIEGLIINFIGILSLFFFIAFFLISQRKDLSALDVLILIFNKHILNFAIFSFLGAILGGVFWCTVIYKIKLNNFIKSSEQLSQSMGTDWASFYKSKIKELDHYLKHQKKPSKDKLDRLNLFLSEARAKGGCNNETDLLDKEFAEKLTQVDQLP